MRRILSSLGSLLALLGLIAVSPSTPFAQQRGGGPTGATAPPGRGGAALAVGPYEAVANWPTVSWPQPGYIWGSQAGIFPESSNRIFLASRGELKLPAKVPNNFNGVWAALGLGGATAPLPEFRNCIVVVDGNGRLIESWTQWDKLFEGGRGPHQIYISPYDPQRRVWVVDDMRHAIFIFSNDGTKLLQTLGIPDEFGDNDDAMRFRRPTDIAWLPDSTFFVSDGYGNKRVVKFDKNGRFLKRALSGAPTPFATVHGIAVAGSPPRVFVSDRGNRRIQVFDEDLNFVEYWPDIAPHTITASADGHIWAYDRHLGEDGQVRSERTPRYSFGTSGVNGTGRDLTKFWGVHQIAADSEGNLYVAEVFNGRAVKLRPRPGADPSHVVWGQQLMPITARPASRE